LCADCFSKQDIHSDWLDNLSINAMRDPLYNLFAALWVRKRQYYIFALIYSMAVLSALLLYFNIHLNLFTCVYIFILFSTMLSFLLWIPWQLKYRIYLSQHLRLEQIVKLWR
ncbi:hypothetical protein, partial [Acidithiobacillus ferrooxidans]|uniref:hypothetical protein n=1 Tax=Acidithiobacillus ferrooxidans TaxID=920 RepID=UPI0019D6C5FE